MRAGSQEIYHERVRMMNAVNSQKVTAGRYAYEYEYEFSFGFEWQNESSFVLRTGTCSYSAES